MTTTQDLSTLSPVEIDTALAEIYTRLYANWDANALNEAHIDDMTNGLQKYLDGDRSYSSYTQEALDRLLLKRDHLRMESRRILAESHPYQAEYNRRPWTRFYLVRNNGGHIHSSMYCSTCYPTTRFGWLPELSGQTEAEAVAAHGAILCTVCYPSAPTEWTDRHDDSVCEGSGKYYDSSQPHRGPGFYSGNWATCSGCGTRQTMTKSGKIRKHKK